MIRQCTSSPLTNYSRISLHALKVLYNVRGYVYTTGHLDWFLIMFEVLIVFWSVAYKQGWDRNEKAIALKWGQ